MAGRRRHRAVLGISPWTTLLKLWEFKTHAGAAKAAATGLRWKDAVTEMLVEKLASRGHAVEIVASNVLAAGDAEPPALRLPQAPRIDPGAMPTHGRQGGSGSGCRGGCGCTTGRGGTCNGSRAGWADGIAAAGPPRLRY